MTQKLALSMPLQEKTTKTKHTHKQKAKQNKNTKMN